METYFGSVALTEARHLLRIKLSEKLKDHDICEVVSCRNTYSRSCHEANAQDITGAVHYMSNGENPPKFLVKDIKKLQLLSPALAVTQNQSASLLLMEKKIQRMEERMDHADDAVARHEKQLVPTFVRSTQEVLDIPKATSSTNLGAWAKPLNHIAQRPAVPSAGATAMTNANSSNNENLMQSHGASGWMQQLHERIRQQQSGDDRWNKQAKHRRCCEQTQKCSSNRIRLTYHTEI